MSKIHLTCFGAHKQLQVNCKKTSCRQWMKSDKFHNCAIIGANSGPMTLQEIGEILNVTRMRVCQIEKSILDKLADHTCDL
jgi:hypothetical protein